MICSRNPFSIFLFSTSSWEIKQKLTSAEQILTAKFSYLKDKVIVLTTQGKLRFYLLSFYDAVFLKDFGCLHDGGVRDFEVSLNCAYIFTIGLLDNSIKVWDYNFRGNLVPSYQCFSLNEPVSLLTISNDENPWVFTSYDNTLNTWMFKGSFEDMKLKNHAEEIAAREKSLLEVQKNSPIVMQNAPSLTSKPDNLSGDQRISTKPLQSGADGRHFVGEEVPGDLQTQDLVKKLERLQAEVNSNPKSNPNSTTRTKEVRFQDELTSLGKTDQMDQEFIELEKALLKNTANFKSGTDNLSEIERVTGERQTNLSVMQDFDKYKHDCLGIEQIFGTQTMLPSSIRWDVTNDYYLVSTFWCINYFNEQETQTLLENVFLSNPSGVYISSHSKYLVVTFDASPYEPSACFSVYDARSLARFHSSRIPSADKFICADISPKEDYLLIVFKQLGGQESYSFLQVWDILNNKVVVESAINETVKGALYNPYGLQSGEFVTLTKDKLYFWRMSRGNNSLQYQIIHINDMGGKIDKHYTAFSWMELTDTYKTCLILVGTAHGGLIFVDSRSAVVIGYLNSMINEPVASITCNGRAVNIGGPGSNIYSYFLKAETSLKTPADYMKIFEEVPQIISLDGKIGSVHFPKEHGGVEGLATTSAGTIWYLNWKERLTIKLKTWHNIGKKVLCLAVDQDSGKAVTSGADYTIKVWKESKGEEEVEFFIPNKGCLAMIALKDKLLAAFTDGCLRAYELVTYSELGTIAIDSCALVSLCTLPNELNVLVGTIKGDIHMIRIESHQPFRVEMSRLVESMDRVWEVKCGAFEGMSSWGYSAQGRAFKIWKRKDIYRLTNDQEEDDKMKFVKDLEYYLIDSFSLPNPHREAVETKSGFEFNPIEPYTIFMFTSGSSEVTLRNYKEHMNLRTIKLNDFPTSLAISYYEDLLFIGSQTGRIDVIDFYDGKTKDFQIVHSSEVISIKLRHESKESRLGTVNSGLKQTFLYAADKEDPRNKSKFLKYIYSLSQDDLVRSEFSKASLAAIKRV